MNNFRMEIVEDKEVPTSLINDYLNMLESALLDYQFFTAYDIDEIMKELNPDERLHIIRNHNKIADKTKLEIVKKYGFKKAVTKQAMFETAKKNLNTFDKIYVSKLDNGDYQILRGHTLLEVAKYLGIENVPVTIMRSDSKLESCLISLQLNFGTTKMSLGGYLDMYLKDLIKKESKNDR